MWRQRFGGSSKPARISAEEGPKYVRSDDRLVVEINIIYVVVYNM